MTQLSRLEQHLIFRYLTLQPTAHAGLVAEIDVAELAFEIGFLASDHAVANDKIERHQRGEDPQTIEADGEADLAEEHADIDGVAREAIRSVCDDRHCRLIGLDPSARLADRYDRPNREGEADGEHGATEPGAWNGHRDEPQWIEPVGSQTRDKCKRPCDRRANNHISVV